MFLAPNDSGERKCIDEMLEADNIVMWMQCCNDEMKGLRRRKFVMIGVSSPDNFRRNDHFDTSVEEVGGRGKRRDSKVSVLIYLAVFQGQVVGKWEGAGNDRRQGASATGFVKEESREGGFGKAHANVQ